MFRAYFSKAGDSKIEEIIPEEVFDKTVHVDGRSENKQTYSHKWTNTREEAYDWLVETGRKNVESAEEDFVDACKARVQVESLQEPTV